MTKDELPEEIEKRLSALRLQVDGSIVDDLRDAIISALFGDESEEGIAREAARDRILGVAIWSLGCFPWAGALRSRKISFDIRSLTSLLHTYHQFCKPILF